MQRDMDTLHRVLVSDIGRLARSRPNRWYSTKLLLARLACTVTFPLPRYTMIAPLLGSAACYIDFCCLSDRRGLSFPYRATTDRSTVKCWDSAILGDVPR